MAAVVVVVATVATAGVLGLGALAIGGLALMKTVVVGATIGGLLLGGLEIAAQIEQNGIQGIDLASVAIETFTGSALGAISGAMSATSSAAARLAYRGAKVLVGGLNSILHGINNGYSSSKILKDLGVALLKNVAMQAALYTFVDGYTGKHLNDVLSALKIDGALVFGTEAKLLLAGALIGNKIWDKIFD